MTDDYYDEDEFEDEWDDDDEEYVDDEYGSRLAAIEAYLAGQEGSVEVPESLAQEFLEHHEEGAMLDQLEENLDEDLSDVEAEIGRELTSKEIDGILDVAFGHDMLPTELLEHQPELVLDDLGSDEDRVQLTAQIMSDTQEEIAEAEGSGGEPIVPETQ